MMKMEREQLFMIIEETSFALDETKLYLDTHPTDCEALDYYEKLKKIRNQAWRDYTNLFGPLSAYDVNVNNRWAWVTQPWPWELEG